MRRPLLVTVVVVSFLIFLGLPFLRADFGSPDHRVLPEGNPAREVSEALETDFDSNEGNAFPVVVTDDITDAQVTDFATRLSARGVVERLETLARVRPAHDDPALVDGRRVEGVRRLAELLLGYSRS